MKKLKRFKPFKDVCVIHITDHSGITKKTPCFYFRLKNEKGEHISSAKFDKLLSELVSQAKTEFRVHTLLMPGLRKEFALAYAMAPREYPRLTKSRKRRKSSSTRAR